MGYTFHYNENMLEKVNKTSLKGNILKGLFIKTAHQEIISFLLARPTEQFYGSEISKKTRISIGQTSKVMNDLFKAGLLERDQKGKTVLYRIRGESPILRTYKVLNTLIHIEPLIDKLKGISKEIFLYGSCAKGVNVEDSDLDLLVVTNKSDEVINFIAAYPSNEYQGFSEIKPVLKTPAEWVTLDEKDQVFYNEVQKGILLYEREIDESRL